MTMHCNVSNIWKEPTPYVNVNNTWKEVQNIYVNASNVWKEVYSSGPSTIGDFYQGAYYAGDYAGKKILVPSPSVLLASDYRGAWQDCIDWCQTFTTGGYSGWSLPSYWQMQVVYNALAIIEANSGQKYHHAYCWTSTYQSPNYYYVDLRVGQWVGFATTEPSVRYGAFPIRLLT